jgi:hypothetical protein
MGRKRKSNDPDEPKKPKKPRKKKISPRRERLLNIFNADWGDAEKRLHMEMVVAGAKNAKWLAAAIIACYRVPYEKPIMTTDDFWYACRDIPPPDEPRVMTGVTKALLAAGLIVRTEMHRESVRTVCNRRPLRIWRSLVCPIPFSPRMLRPT